MRRRVAIWIVITAALLTFVAGDALADSAATTDCVHHGRLTRHYTNAQLSTALVTMSPDLKEYNSECYQLILNQLHQQLGDTHVGPTTTPPASNSGGSLISTPLLIVIGVIVLVGGGFAFAASRRGG